LPLPCSKRLKRFLPLHLKASPGNVKLHLSDFSVLLLLSRLSLSKVFGNAAKGLEEVWRPRLKKAAGDRH
jgi:hypothetical protein